MNKYEHADHSAQLFGGKASEYEEFHATIDSNKVVTPSIFGRFFLHHFDVGLIILTKLFGETIGKKRVSVKQILLQHLIEDYGKPLTFKNDWARALKENASQLPKLDEWESFVEKSKRDLRLKNISANYLEELEEFFTLSEFGITDIPTNVAIAIFGHALGGDLLARIIGPKFHNRWTSDVITGYLNCRFKWSDRTRDVVPTLLDYEKFVPDQPWMHAPEDYGLVTIEEIKKKIETQEQIMSINKLKVPKRFIPGGTLVPHRRPCNLD